VEVGSQEFGNEVAAAVNQKKKVQKSDSRDHNAYISSSGEMKISLKLMIYWALVCRE
jgi:hypothetical protein